MAEIDKNLEGTEKLEKGEVNNKKDGKKVMIELDISSQVEDTGRLPLKELNQNNRIKDGEGKSGERNIRSGWRRKKRQEKNETIQGNETIERSKKAVDTKESGIKKRRRREF